MWNLGQGRYLALPILAEWSEQQPKHHWPAIPFTVILLSQSPSLLHDNSESIQPSWDQYETRDSWYWSPRSASQFLLLGSCSSLWCPLTSLNDNALASHTPPASQSGGAHTGLWALYHWAARTLCWAISLHNTRTKEPAGVGWWDDGEPPQPCKHASPDPDYKVLLDTTGSSLPYRSRYRITWKEGIT